MAWKISGGKTSTIGGPVHGLPGFLHNLRPIAGEIVQDSATDSERKESSRPATHGSPQRIVDAGLFAAHWRHVDLENWRTSVRRPCGKGGPIL
jgi:hypothetical protein